MQNVRVEQAEYLVTTLKCDYNAFVLAPRKPWLSPEDKIHLRQTLEASMQNARAAVQTMDQQPGLRADLRYFKDQMTRWSEMAAGDLKTTRAN
jgi:uncharacterized protein HemX